MDFVRNNNVISNDMFKNATKLVGAAGTDYQTVFSSSHTNADYAQIATPSQPGYFTSDLTFVRYTITYNLDGGTSNNPSYYRPETLPITLTYPTRTGYTFDGWTGANGETIEKDVTIPVGTTGNLTYTAHYTPNTYAVIFDPNGGEGNMDNQSFTYGETQTLSSNEFTRPNYKFNGWNTRADGTGTTYSNREQVSNLVTEGTITLYAQWREIQVAVTVFNAAGPCQFNGSGSNITGNACQAYWNEKYINTHIQLFSTDNYDEDFDVSFTIDSYKPSQQEEAQVTLINEMLEVNGKSVMGFLFRRVNTSYYLLLRGGTTTEYKQTIAATSVQSIRIVRKNKHICIGYNGETPTYVYSYGNSSTRSDIPVFFGAAADGNGDPWRYVKGTFSNMIIKMGADETVECSPN